MNPFHAYPVQAVLSRLARTLVAMLLIVSIGGHWAVLQSVAWVSMVVDFSKGAPLSVAVAKTFDGKHACKLCKFVRKGQSTEQKQEVIKSKIKIDFWMPFQAISDTDLAQSLINFPTFDVSFTSRGETPPVPPPRFA